MRTCSCSSLSVTNGTTAPGGAARSRPGGREEEEVEEEEDEEGVRSSIVDRKSHIPIVLRDAPAWQPACLTLDRYRPRGPPRTQKGPSMERSPDQNRRRLRHHALLSASPSPPPAGKARDMYESAGAPTRAGARRVSILAAGGGSGRSSSAGTSRRPPPASTSRRPPPAVLRVTVHVLLGSVGVEVRFRCRGRR